VWNQLQLAYLGIEVPDPASLTPCFGDVVGLVPGEPGSPAGSLAWRNDDRAQRVVLRPGAANDAVYVGFEAAGEAAFEAVAARLETAGYPVEEGSAELVADRRVSRLASTTAPWGVGVELVDHLRSASHPYSSALMPGGFFTTGVGFGHVVFATVAFEESHHFATDGLGFEQSDWLEIEIAEGVELEVRFYHCNERHHTLALAKAPFELPQTLHHVMFEANKRDDVGAAFDRAWASGLPIPNGLGRHDNDGMFSFYVASPAGFLVEVGHGAKLVTEKWDENRRYDRMSLWGHKPLRPTAP